MNIRKLALAAMLGSAACGGALATITPSTTGLTTTYFENFDGGTSFTTGGWLNVPFSSDDHLWLTDLTPTSSSASFQFSSAENIASLDLSFWYSVPAGNAGQFTLASLTPTVLGDTPGNGLAFIANNPGPGGSTADAFFSTSVNNLLAGTYTLTFAKIGGALNSLKVDDVTLAVTAVPEPETYALLLAGLGLMGFVARRRRPQPN